MGSPFDNGFVCVARPFAPLENGPPPPVCPMGHDGWRMGGATHQLNPLKTHLQRISKIAVCSRKLATQVCGLEEANSGPLVRPPPRGPPPDNGPETQR